MYRVYKYIRNRKAFSTATNTRVQRITEEAQTPPKPPAPPPKKKLFYLLIKVLKSWNPLIIMRE